LTGLKAELARDFSVYSSSDLMTGMNPLPLTHTPTTSHPHTYNLSPTHLQSPSATTTRPLKMAVLDISLHQSVLLLLMGLAVVAACRFYQVKTHHQQHTPSANPIPIVQQKAPQQCTAPHQHFAREAKASGWHECLPEQRLPHCLSPTLSGFSTRFSLL
jgi:hypothetical protein